MKTHELTKNIILYYDENFPSHDLIFLSDTISNSLLLINKNISNKIEKIKLNLHIYGHWDNSTLALQNKNLPSELIFIESFDGINAVINCDFLFVKKLKLNPKKQSRHLIHELCHLINWANTSSIKQLNDNNKAINIPSWKDEGICEIVSCLLTKNYQLLEQSKHFFASNQQNWNTDKANQELNSLSSKNRSNAFLFSIGKLIFDLSIPLETYFNSDQIQPLQEILNKAYK